jgi:secreted Zn-dependent insulinase-like peptidase
MTGNTGAVSAPLFVLELTTYSIIRLANGLEAVLISDPTTDKAAAALSVRVGHLSDPVRLPCFDVVAYLNSPQEELQGLAHFW